MSSRHAAGGEVPFSFPVKVGHVSVNELKLTLEANDGELLALASFLDVVSVDHFSAQLQLSRWRQDGVKIKGRVRAGVTQLCVVTLEPVSSLVDEPVERILVPEGSKLARLATDERGEIVLDPNGPDIPDEFYGDTIDAGALVTECAALAIDPYPRKQDAAFFSDGEAMAERAGEDKPPSPFAVLKDWKKQ